MDALAALRVMTDSMDAYDRHDFVRLAALYAEDVTWVGVEPSWTCHDRDEIFEMFRARMDAGVHVWFDEIRATRTHVILTAGIGDSPPVVSVFRIEDGRITSVRDFPDREAAEAALSA